MRVGIVIALAAEARCLARPQGSFLADAHYEVRLSGPGPLRAERAARELLAAGCDALLSFGLAGGLAPELRPGALLLANAIHSAQGEVLSCDDALHAALRARLQTLTVLSAPLYSAPAAIVTTRDKLALHARLGVAAVDMESAAIARVAHERQRPCAVLRCVVDPAGFTLPRAALAGMAEDGGSRPLASAAALLRHPLELPHLIRLALWYGGALRALRGAGALLCSQDSNEGGTRDDA